MTQGHAKGRRGERDVARICAEWWQRMEPTAKFKRTPLSGGWGGKEDVDVRAHFKACGDLMTTSARWPFTVEVKWREGWSVDNLFAGKPTPPWKWWTKCCEDAADEGGEPMLWLRRNRARAGRSFPWLVMLRRDYYLEAKLPEPDVSWNAIALGEKVDFGLHLPVLYMYDRIIRMSPERVALRVAS